MKGCELVKCLYHHWADVRCIRNEARAYFIDQKTIEVDEHHDFMIKNHENYRTIVYYGERAGFIGHVEGDIRIGIMPKFRRRGIGKWALKAFLSEYPDQELTAKIKSGNKASRKVFESCGFLEVESEIVHYVLNR